MTADELRAWIRRSARLYMAPAMLEEVARLIEAATPEIARETALANLDADMAVRALETVTVDRDRIARELEEVRGLLADALASLTEARARAADVESRHNALKAELEKRPRWRLLPPGIR